MSRFHLGFEFTLTPLLVRRMSGGVRELNELRRRNLSGRGNSWLTLFAGIMFAFPAFALTVVKGGTGLIAYWPFDEGFSAVSDAGGFNAVPFNGAQIDTGRSRFGGGSVRLSRADQQWVLVSSSPFGQNSYSYSVWYYIDVDDIAGTDRYFVLEASDGTNWPASFGLRAMNERAVGNVFSHDNGVGGATPQASFPAGPHRVWRNVIVTYDESTLRLKAYLDGETIAVLPLREEATLLSPSTFLVIGGHREGVGRNWEGWIDELAVWSRVLSFREISLLQEVRPDLLRHYTHPGYAKWVENFTVSQEFRLPGADASGDGVPNLLKYAAGVDLFDTSRDGLPRVESAAGLFVTVPAGENAVMVEFEFEASCDLSEWLPAPFSFADENDGRRRFEIHVPSYSNKMPREGGMTNGEKQP